MKEEYNQASAKMWTQAFSENEICHVQRRMFKEEKINPLSPACETENKYTFEVHPAAENVMNSYVGPDLVLRWMTSDDVAQVVSNDEVTLLNISDLNAQQITLLLSLAAKGLICWNFTESTVMDSTSNDSTGTTPVRVLPVAPVSFSITSEKTHDKREEPEERDEFTHPLLSLVWDTGISNVNADNENWDNIKKKVFDAVCAGKELGVTPSQIHNRATEMDQGPGEEGDRELEALESLCADKKIVRIAHGNIYRFVEHSCAKIWTVPIGCHSGEKNKEKEVVEMCRVFARPWMKFDGSVNKNVLRRLYNVIMYHVQQFPGIAEVYIIITINSHIYL